LNATEDLIVRDARLDERSAIRDLTLTAYAEYARIMQPSAWAGLKQAITDALDGTEPTERIVAERNGKLMGSVLLYPPAADAYGDLTERAHWPEVRLLSVAPEARGQGIGRALLEECVRRARQSGASLLGLHTSESMKVALKLYERMGFVRAPEYDFQPEGAELVQAFLLPLERGYQWQPISTVPK